MVTPADEFNRIRSKIEKRASKRKKERERVSKKVIERTRIRRTRRRGGESAEVAGRFGDGDRCTL